MTKICKIMRTWLRKSMAFGLSTLALVGAATQADAISVGLLHADTATGTVKSYLDPYFDTVDYVDVEYSTPDAATLAGYDALLVWTNALPNNATLLGDRLADYVDAGGGVVLAAFATHPGIAVGGRMATAGYNPMENLSQNFSYGGLYTYDASHSIMAGITSLGGYYRSGGTTRAGAKTVASWSDGKPLASLNADGTVAALALYPGEGPSFGLSGQYDLLFANSLNFVASSVSPVPLPAALPALMTGFAVFGLVGLRRRKAAA